MAPMSLPAEPLLSDPWLRRYRRVLRASRAAVPASLDCRVNITVHATPWNAPVALRARARHGALRWDIGRFRLEDAHVRMTYAMFVRCWCDRSLRPAVDGVTVQRPDIRASGQIRELAVLADAPFPAEEPSVLRELAEGTLVPQL